MATAFRNNPQPRSLHVEGSAQLLPATRSLFKAFENADPASKRQRAITPKLLRDLHTLAGLAFPEIHDTPAAIAADLAIMGLFFAMRLCENTTTLRLGFTKMVGMLGVTVLDNNKREILQDCPGLALAVYVTFLFADQKNGGKNAWRIQKRTDDPVLCPVRRAASLIERILRLGQFSWDPSINTINIYVQQTSKGLVTLQLTTTRKRLPPKATLKGSLRI